MECRWTKTKGQITGAKTQSGERSKLFDNLMDKFGSEKAQELYAVANSDDFLNIYGTSEKSLSEVVGFVVEQNENKEPLNIDQKVDLQNFLIASGNFDVSAFYTDGLFTINTENLKKIGYSSFEIENLLNDVDLQERVKNAVESLKNTPNVDTTSTPFENVEKSSEVGYFGKRINLNPFIVEKEILDLLAGEDENFDEIASQIEYSNFQKSDKTALKEEVKNYHKVEEYKEVEGQISPRKVTETEMILPITVKVVEDLSLSNNINSLTNLRLSTLIENPSEVYNVLKNIENNAIEQGIDVIGLSQKSVNEELIGFLRDLNDFIINPSKEKTQKFANTYDTFFEKSLEPKKSAIKKIKENKDYVKLNTTLSEEQVYEQSGLIKVEDGLYIKTAKQPLEELYSVLEQYPDKIPQGQTLEKYVQEQIGEYDNFTNVENAEAVVLYKMYFDLGAVKIDRNSKGELLAPNGKVSNLNEEQYKLVRTPEFKAWFGDIYGNRDKVKNNFETIVNKLKIIKNCN